MNLSTLCGLSTRFFTTVLFFIGFGLAHAQLNLPKTLDDPGVNPSVTAPWPAGESLLLFSNGSQRLNSQRVYNLNLSDDNNWVIVDEKSTYTAAHPLTYVSDTQLTPVRLYENDSVLFADNPIFTFSLDPFVMAQHDNPYTPYFGAFGGSDTDSASISISGINILSEVSLGTSGTPIVFSAAELAVLGDSDGHTLQLVQTTAAPALSAPIHIAANADTQSIIDSIQLAATAVQTYIEFTENEDGSLSIYADEALEVGEPDTTTPTASKTLDDPGVSPSVSSSWPDEESTLLFSNTSLEDTSRIYNLRSNGTYVIVDERSTYTAAHPLTYVSDTQLTPVRLYDNDSVLLATTPVFTFSLDAFLMAQYDEPLTPFFSFELERGEEKFPALKIEGVDAYSETPSVGTIGTAVSFTAEEITAIMAADSTSLAVVQTATGLRSTLTVPTNTDAQGLADHIQEAANPLTVYIHEVVNDDGTLDIYADEAIEIHYTTANTASIAPLRKQGVLVYPNPVHAQLYLVYPSATPATYTVFDLTGKAHSTHHASGQTHQLNVSSLAKGVYLLKAEHGNQTGVFRFVKE